MQNASTSLSDASTRASGDVLLELLSDDGVLFEVEDYYLKAEVRLLLC